MSRDQRDLVAYLYGREHDPLRSPVAAARQAAGRLPVRVLVAVNSWHEMSMQEYFWYYNTFVLGQVRHLAADCILYVSNVNWDANDIKDQLMFEPQNGFEVFYERCTSTNCVRLFRRSDALSS